MRRDQLEHAIRTACRFAPPLTTSRDRWSRRQQCIRRIAVTRVVRPVTG
jgi:hypothetical protein